MATCDVCGRHENMPYNCRHCGGVHCGEHRLPENHNCPGLETWNDPGGVFDSGFDASIDTGTSGGSVTDRITAASGLDDLTGYFRGNVSFLFLAIIVVVFVVQFAVFPLLGYPPGTELWYNVFTVNTANPAYVWTWLISVFSHGGIMHLVFNAIVLYFFGPILERQIGSRKFTALFILSGMAAGLAQVGVALVTGETVSVLGASGALMAVMGVLAITAPDLKVLLFFFIPMSIRTLALLYAAFSVFAFVSQGGLFDGIAHFAHLTGLLIGLWYGNRVKHRVGGGPKQLTIGGRRGGGGGGPGRRFP